MNVETQTIEMSKVRKLAEWIDDNIGVDYEINDDGDEGNIVVFDVTMSEYEQIKEVESQIINGDR